MYTICRPLKSEGVGLQRVLAEMHRGMRLMSTLTLSTSAMLQSPFSATHLIKLETFRMYVNLKLWSMDSRSLHNIGVIALAAMRSYFRVAMEAGMRRYRGRPIFQSSRRGYTIFPSNFCSCL